MTSNVAHELSDRRPSPTARSQPPLSFVPSNIPSSTTELSNPNGTLGIERVQKPAQSAGTDNLHVTEYPSKSLATPSGACGASDPAPQSSDIPMSIPKKANLLTDLMDTETSYVELLAGIIKKVAGAWSRSNLPPQELDTMFRAIESIYKAHRSLLMRLKDIAFDPSSAKVLGDLLMGWAEELEQPYASYSSNYLTGFDLWEPVQANDRVRTVLAMFSSSYPPSLPPSSPEHPPDPPIWKLDGLFLLPQSRLKYYHRLYSRLLKSSAPGKGDHELLSKAVAKVEKLLNMLSSRATMRVAVMHQSIQLEGRSTTALISAEASTAQPPRDSVRRPEDPAGEVVSHDSDLQWGSPTRANPLATRGPDIQKRASTPSVTITHLERRLSTDRTLDIFTMKPKEIRLQISPPSLQYAREVRFSADVAIQLTPQSTGVEVRQERGRVFVLTDLLLVCESMTPEEQIRHGQDGPDMWLLYPPFAGKHLQTGPVENSTTAMSINIIGKEILILNARLPHIRDRLLSELSNCIGAFANLRTSINKSAPPAPQDPTYPTSPSTVSCQQSSDSPLRYAETHSGSMAPPARVLSPNDDSLTPLNPPRAAQQPIPSDTSWVSDMTTLALTDASKPQMQRLLSDPNKRKYPPRSTSIAPERRHAQPPGGPPLQPSFSPGQVVPPQVAHSGQLAHGASFRPGQIVPIEAFTQSQPAFIDLDSSQSSFNPGQIVPVRRGTSMRSEHYYVNGEIASQPPIGQYPSQGFRSGGLDAFSNDPGQFANLTSRSLVESAGPGSFRRPVPSRLPRSQYDTMSTASAPIVPAFSRDAPQSRPNFFPRAESLSSMRSLHPQLQPRHPPLLPSQQMRLPPVPATLQETSPPCSPVEETPPWTGPTTTHITMQMKCKVFLQQQHQQWKSLGYANLKLYCELPTYVKQLVVNKDKSILISTIILADGVERVGKTGVAVELSDRGRRSGIIYMLQLRNEKSAEELFERLIAGSDRSAPTKNAH
ncbi:uncharacterized protein LAESUDRAFT_750365 [Laetiporus sulphureus 93-53]|uniref:DH domain-containing protein n=1 Tax=Laetiporus sulphureus 93-53 TaxID=1314785 RepID=A0A165DZQ9_9APHY|nr:uncharacterized protein LAESUDRAFT_750365 [Laetiporus sulphureus 93-53]KZT05969.1 hypothetical protein LAESUDRAFT_750365 [Laetiporus sulphureus 93-53]